MTFKFRLEKVQRHRQRLVDARSREVAEAGRYVRALDARIEGLRDDLEAFCRAGVVDRGVAVHATRLQERTAWVEHLRTVLDGLRENRVAAAAELERRRETLTLAWRDLEVLNKLRERRRDAWRDEQRRLETRVLDEVGQQRAERARRSKVSG